MTDIFKSMNSATIGSTTNNNHNLPGLRLSQPGEDPPHPQPGEVRFRTRIKVVGELVLETFFSIPESTWALLINHCLEDEGQAALEGIHQAVSTAIEAAGYIQAETELFEPLEDPDQYVMMLAEDLADF